MKEPVSTATLIAYTAQQMPLEAAFDSFDVKTPWGTGYYCMQTEDMLPGQLKLVQSQSLRWEMDFSSRLNFPGGRIWQPAGCWEQAVTCRITQRLNIPHHELLTVLKMRAIDSWFGELL